LIGARKIDGVTLAQKKRELLPAFSRAQRRDGSVRVVISNTVDYR
jgi:hypothetical protein